MRRSLAWLAIAAPILVAGCFWQVTLRTTIAPDGATERFVSVTGNNVHDVCDAFDTPPAEVWTTYELARDSYTVAGRFTSPAEAPPGYARRIKATGETAPGRIEWRRDDRVFYTLFTYRETVTNIVTPDRFDSAADGLLDTGLDLLGRTLDAWLGDTYDLSRLQTHLQMCVRPALKSAAWALYASAGRETDGDTPARKATINRVLRQHRIDADLPLFETDVNETRAARFLTDLVADHVRLKSAPDTPLTKAQRDALADLLSRNMKTNEEDRDDPIERYFVERFGSKEQGDAALARLWTGLAGAYGELLGPEVRFRASLTMPGTMVCTNGYLDGPSAAAWRFTGKETYPLGYLMEAVSASYHDGAQRAVAAAPFVTTGRQVMAFEALVQPLGDADRKALMEALAACVRARSIEALDAFIAARDARGAPVRSALGIKGLIEGRVTQE